MAHILTKRGAQDNIVTYEHMCDTHADLNNIPKNQMTLGSTAIVLRDENDALGVYMSDSNKEWVPLLAVGGETTPPPSSVDLLHVLSSSDYDPDTHVPTVENPEMNVVYLVPSGEETGNNLFDEWIYTGDSWERFGGVPVNNTAVQADWNEDDESADAHILNRPNVRKGSDPTGVVEGMLQNVASGEYSHAEGSDTTASGQKSHAEGSNTTASGHDSHAEGDTTVASGASSHAEGKSTTAAGEESHAEGGATIADSYRSHAEGSATIANGYYAHAEGRETRARGDTSHAEGMYTQATGQFAHVENGSSSFYTIDIDVNPQQPNTATYSSLPSEFDINHYSAYYFKQSNKTSNLYYITNINTDTKTLTFSASLSVNWHQIVLYKSAVAEGPGSHAEGTSLATNAYAHAEGQLSVASGANSHVEGFGATANGHNSHAEGQHTRANGNGSHAEGSGSENNTAINFTTYTTSRSESFIPGANGMNSHIEGYQTSTSGMSDHAEGYQTSTKNQQGTPGAHAEGYRTIASSAGHAEGYQTLAQGHGSHAEGYETQATGTYSHGEGYATWAAEIASHAEGYQTYSNGHSSHTEGYETQATGNYSHAEGQSNYANGIATHVFGAYNIYDNGNPSKTTRGTYIEIVGNGVSNSSRSNARTLDWNGNETLAGTLTCSNSITIGNTTITEAQLQALLALLP